MRDQIFKASTATAAGAAFLLAWYWLWFIWYPAWALRLIDRLL